MSKASGKSFGDDIVLSGYQRKLKTMKKKYFVLYKTSQFGVARLEYYDNEKKFKSRMLPKRVIELKNCFNINRRLDTKYDFAIALSTKEGGFGIVLNSEEEMRKWLEILINLQRFESSSSNYHQYFEHVWQVQVQKKGLAEDKGIFGQYHVGLTSKSITFIRIGPERTPNGEIRKTNIDFLLTTVRRCGDSQCYFYMEVGRQSVTGPGELWMETEDSLTAQNMHRMILSAMSSKSDLNVEPMRKRSSSANEASKPINVLHKRQHQPENRSINSPQSLQNYVRERCDSLPSRNRIPSENSCSSQISIQNFRNASNQRVHAFQRHSNSPPMNNAAICSESEESSVSIDEQDDSSCMFGYRIHSRSSEGVIPEENTDEIVIVENKSHELNFKASNVKVNELPCQDVADNYVSMAPVKNTSSIGESNNMNLKHKLFMMELKNCLPTVGSLHRDLYKSTLEFTEFTADRIPKSQFLETEAQIERPTRTFSIGSKTEHNKLNHRLNNAIETDNSCRVRAFSVGSRAKIPRCELQKGVLFTKNAEHNSNNNIYGPSNPSIQIPCREKKSTSAPLLLNKSQNSVDLMGDLMEIDFSKNEHISYPARPTKKPIYFKSSIYNNREEKINTHTVERNIFDEKVSQNEETALQNDSGYLEMKPVRNVLDIGVSPSLANAPSAAKDCKRKSFEPNDNDVINKSENLENSENCNFKNGLNDHVSAKDVSFLSDKFDSANLNHNFDIVHQKPEDFVKADNFINNRTIQNDGNSTFRQMNNRLMHSASDDYCEASAMHKEYNKAGYEIQQNKSDGSLDFHKPTFFSQECFSPNIQMSDKVKCANVNNGSNLTIGPLSFECSTTKLADTYSESSSGALNPKQQLYYASLDLPPSGTETKTVQKDNSIYSSPMNSPGETPKPNVNNLYAKIDFEYSDSPPNQVNA